MEISSTTLVTSHSEFFEALPRRVPNPWTGKIAASELSYNKVRFHLKPTNAMTQGLDAETTFIEGRIDRIFSPNDKITIRSLMELSTFFTNKLCVSLPKFS
jgi:hypothetical protein